LPDQPFLVGLRAGAAHWLIVSPKSSAHVLKAKTFYATVALTAQARTQSTAETASLHFGSRAAGLLHAKPVRRTTQSSSKSARI
jgi:hypothetical protein